MQTLPLSQVRNRGQARFRPAWDCHVLPVRRTGVPVLVAVSDAQRGLARRNQPFAQVAGRPARHGAGSRAAYEAHPWEMVRLRRPAVGSVSEFGRRCQVAGASEQVDHCE